MPAQRIPMRKLKDTLRLRAAGLTIRQISASLRLSVGVVSKYLSLASRAELTWPLPDHLVDDDALERALHGLAPHPTGAARFAEPDCPSIHAQLKRKGVTLRLLWEEYRACHPEDGYQLTAFCARYREWCAGLKTSMRQSHTAGDKLFLDYAGPTVPVFDAGRLRQAQIFVAVLGASNYTYAEATWSQQLPDWIASHVRALEFFGGVPALFVPDCLKSAVTKADRYEPQLQRTYEELAAHYETAILPARPAKPKDKAKVEVGVQIVERWILARLRNVHFESLAALNDRIRELVVELNERPFRKLPGCRRELFERVERPALRPLPSSRFEYCEWRTARVGIDYHVEAAGHAYSVPHALVRRTVDVRLTGATIEVFLKGRRVAAHPRSSARGGHTTVPEHMPASHRAHREWTPASLLVWAAGVGPSVHEVIAHTLETKPHPEQGYRSCLGLRSLAKRYGGDRLDAACRRAVMIGGVSLESIGSILKVGLDRLPLVCDDGPRDLELVHENVRGPEYYKGEEPSEEVLPC
jgi:transposase